MLILIPHSEGKTPGGAGPPLGEAPSPTTGDLIARLNTFDGDAEKLHGVKGKALAAALEANENVLASPTMPAIERYKGVVYQGIDYASLDKKARTHFDKHVRIVSPLFGLVAPRDPLPDYKLRMDKLDAAKLWKPVIAEELGATFVLDLLPQAHRKAVACENGLAVDFYVQSAGKRKPAAHHGKLVKGKFVRWLCENQIKTPDEFVEFRDEGYFWDGTRFLKEE
ncbi:MAG: peroxide stress protein YaaA [Sumerlaeia bacterium]